MQLTIARDESDKFYCVYGKEEIPGGKTIEVSEDVIKKIKYETLEHVDYILKYLFATKSGRIYGKKQIQETK